MFNIDLLNAVIQAQDDIRKRRIGVILAWGVLVLASISMLSLFAYSGPDGFFSESNFRDPEFLRLFWGTIASLVFGVAFLLLEKTKISANLLGVIFLTGFTVILFNSDTPINLVAGPSTILMLFPVFMGAVLIHSSAALIVAAVLLVPFITIPPTVYQINWYSWFSVMGLALVIWVATFIMEKAVREAREEAYRSKAMLGIASHELRTPLGVIIGNAGMLKLPLPLEKSKEMIETISRSAISLNEIVSRLLDQAHIQSGKVQLKPADVCMADLVKGVTEEITPFANEKSLRLSVSVQDRVPEKVQVDPLRVKQILINLLSNAVKYTEVGSVSLNVDFHVAKKKKELIFAVTDTGVGIPKNKIASMFKPFVQGEQYDTRTYGGVGLGLSIVKELAKLMKGTINVKSVLGTGSTFTITIPLE
ncbi:MAG TPA: HAMP domain-containing sensor histidine kinase [Oculatellaceae cyanobacterium]